MIDATLGYLDKAARNLASAKTLIDVGDYDSAASRLYFAMFYCAEVLLDQKNGLRFKSHQAVISGFGQHFARTNELPAVLHAWLQGAFEDRHTADCSESADLEREDAERLLQRAGEFLRITRQNLGVEPR